LGLFAVIGSGAVPEMLAPAFAVSSKVGIPMELTDIQLSILFCASTALTEWITTRKVSLVLVPIQLTSSTRSTEHIPASSASSCPRRRCSSGSGLR
jgi:hypothetical protein